MDKQQYAITAQNQYCAQNYAPLEVVLTHGKGIWLWDIQGKRYLDMMSAYSAVSHGHCHPQLIAAMTNQAKQLCVTSRAFYNDKLGPFLKKLCELTQLDMALPMNTGAEAVETAIKAARRWGYRHKHIPANQAEIIVASNNFHGRTLTVTSFATEAEYKKDYGPFTPGFKVIPFGEVAALKKAITPNTCAFLVEPMQGEAGVQIPPSQWLKQCAELCQQHKVLLLLDEIQTGLGRTGKLFAYQHANIQPDGVMLGKALGGGILPVSAFIARKEVMEVFDPGSHGSTFGGNPLASAVGLAALEQLEREALTKNSAVLGAYLLKSLHALNYSFIQAIRGKGLWIGIDIDPQKISARAVCEVLMAHGILSKEAHHTVIRLAPPLIIQRKEIDWAIEQLQQAFDKIEQALSSVV
jgi:ornithine--oxo-acid transaminase